jgi:phosphatidylserine/phosphatidylglycerophosphate/cardiolipin synthase-like enzyme
MKKLRARLRIFLILSLLVLASVALSGFGEPPPGTNFSDTTTGTTGENISSYYSPNGGIKDLIISKIRSSQKSIMIAVHSFALKDVADALVKAKNRGVDVRVIMDEVNSEDRNLKLDELNKAGIFVKLRTGIGESESKSVNNKFAIFDEAEVIAGSYNWSDPSASSSSENAVFIKDPAVVKKYVEDFDRMYWE